MMPGKRYVMFSISTTYSAMLSPSFFCILLRPWRDHTFKKETTGAALALPLSAACVIYLMLPYSFTLMVTEGIAVMSLEMVILPPWMSFTSWR